VVGNTSDGPTTAEVARRLQQLGLKEYEAKCFVALTSLATGTAREISEQVDVPRTRVYEAARTLESHGLIDIQHSSPQRFRAVPIQEAVSILRRRYESRIDRLEADLRQLETTRSREQDSDGQEVWSLTGRDAIATRTNQLLENAEEEALLIICDDRVVSSHLLEWLDRTLERDCTLRVGSVSPSLNELLSEELSDAAVFHSRLEWLHPDQFDDDPPVCFLLVTDGETVLISGSCLTGDSANQHAIYGTGAENCMVVVTRQLAKLGLEDSAC
jgi:sugar-specific transcriptional regulator TrmB